MNDAKHEEKWKAETLREERKARLARMKSKDGGKKPVKTNNRTVRIILAIVLVVALLGTSVWWAFSIGLPEQYVTVMSIADNQVKAIEYNFYYHLLASNYNMDLSDPATLTSLKEPSGIEGYATLGDYLQDMAAKEVQKNVILAKLAKDSGMTFEAADQTQLDSIYTNLKDSALQAGISIDNYLAKTFGKGATQASLRPTLERYLLANKYSEKKQAEPVFADDAIQTYYDAHKDEFDILSYRSFTFTSAAASTATDDEKTKAFAAIKAKADAMLAAVTDEASFKAQCLVYATADEKASYQNEDASLSTKVRYSDVSSTDMATWLFDETQRKAGDKTIIEDGTTSCTVVYFLSRAMDKTPRASVRHILIKVDRTTATADEIAAAKTKAEAILAEYLAGAKTEDSFAELAKTNSADGNASTGGLYDSVYPGQMVTEFNDWCFDAARKPGDTGIVQTDYGFHIMYYVKQGTEEWKVNVSDALRSEAYDKFLADETAKYPFKMDSFGKRFITA
jgi:hypothetical protein